MKYLAFSLLLLTGCTTMVQNDPEPWRAGCTYKATVWAYIPMPGTTRYELECNE